MTRNHCNATHRNPDAGTALSKAKHISPWQFAFFRIALGIYLVQHFARMVSWVRVTPRPLRDCVYDWIARHRYRWFSRYETCRVPTLPHRDQRLP